MSFEMKKRVCILLISIFVLLAMIPLVVFRKEQPEGEYITKSEILILTELLDVVLEEYYSGTENAPLGQEWEKEELETLREETGQWEEGFITYKYFKQWKKNAENIFMFSYENEEVSLNKKYKNSFFLLKEDWYRYFNELCRLVDPDEKIVREELVVLGDSSNVTDVEGNAIEKIEVFSQNGRWEKRIDADFIPRQQKATYITYQGVLWGVYDIQEEIEIPNVWIVDTTEEELIYFYQNYKVVTLNNGISEVEREQVADLIFSHGKLQNVEMKTEKITGKVLKISAEEVELEGLGSFILSDHIQYYRLYDRLENVGRSEVRLGYDFADFVIEDGEIQAVLLVKDEKMENIRVLIKNSNYDGYFHDEIVVKANVDLELIYGNEKVEIVAGETFIIYPDSEYFVTNRIFLKPKALTGRCRFTNIDRNNGGQGYYGIFELEKREEGILLINEVLLEEYLYAVVPSEMPGYYPLEALKAQAISARTYAYNKMINSGLGGYGAHLDDSATYQVYNNIKENANTTTAVKETRGELLYAGDGLAETYYYSTSCGFGTSAAIWNRNNENLFPYLQAKEMTIGSPAYTSTDMQVEEKFADFILKTDNSHFESEESWYRWTYEHENIEIIADKLKSRLENYPNYVSASVDGINFGKEPLEENFMITDIQIKKRGAGGTIEELLVITDKGQMLVKNEYHVRAVLTDGETRVLLQNDNSYACGNLLPSAFFILEPTYENDQVTAIKLSGGGFGHGVGMSQNGAKNLADLGYTAKEILEFYYEGCHVKE